MDIKFIWKSNAAKVALLFLVVLLSWCNPISERAESYVDIGLKRSLVSFATARALDGALSVLQGTEVVLQPLGVGLSLKIGEILDPINHLVEAFSTVMLVASVAFGIQKLLLVIGSNWLISAFVTVVALVWSTLFLKGRAPSWISKLLAVLIFIRFVMPVTMIGSGYVFDHFSARDYHESQGALDTTLGSLTGLTSDVKFQAENESQPPTPTETKSSGNETENADNRALSGHLKEILDKTIATGKASFGRVKISLENVLIDPTAAVLAKYETVKKIAEQAVEKLIRIIVIFLMQTIVVPLILFLGLYRLAREFLIASYRKQPAPVTH